MPGPVISLPALSSNLWTVRTQSKAVSANVFYLCSSDDLIIFFQAYRLASIIPALSNVFRTVVETVGLIVPAY